MRTVAAIALTLAVGCGELAGLDDYATASPETAASTSGGGQGGTGGAGGETGTGGGTGGAAGGVLLSELYADAVIDQNPAAYWRLGERAGATVAIDQAGRFHGAYGEDVLVGQPGIFADELAAHFVASQQTVVAIDALMDFTEGNKAFSLEAWINVTEYLSDNRTLLDFSTSPSGVIQGVRLYVRVNTGTLRFERYDDTGTPDRAESSQPIPQLSWQHVVANYDGATMTLFINGTQVDSIASTRLVPTPSPNDTPTLGARGGLANSSSLFSGTLDEVAVYSEPLEPGVILAHCALPGVVTCVP